MRLFGLLLLVAGALLLAVGVFLGLPFTGIFLLGFIANAGREAGRELAIFLPATVAALGIGYVLLRIGRYLRRPQ
jgi:hypothetical protein